MHLDVSGINYPFLLITHLACADEQIHIEETRFLNQLARNLQINEVTENAMDNILSQHEEQISIDKVIKSIPNKQRDETIKLLIAIAFSDGFFDPKEKEFLDKVMKAWGRCLADLDRLIIEAESAMNKARREMAEQESNNKKIKLSFGAYFLKGMDSIFSRSVVDAIAKRTPKKIREKAQKLRSEILLSGPDYDKAIRICSQIAHDDIIFTEDSLDRSWKILADLAEDLSSGILEIEKSAKRGDAKSAKEVIKQLKEDEEVLEEEIFHSIDNVRNSLYKKRRAINYFTLSFMGKTKAGKSTLHAIVTNEGWDAIGIGKQRTTRYNRVYEWKNIRIVDTPGIGAPGGRSDEEIAKSIIDETDIICFVLTNNNQQETEFQFLKLLKEQAKPLIILLNIQQNLRHPAKLKRFLSNPEKLFSEDKKVLGGHIDRIRKYAKEFYGNDYFHIVPVQLLAAQLSRENNKSEEELKELYNASRLQNFLDSIRLSLIEDGTMRRSQTLLGCTVSDILTPLNWVRNQKNSYLALVEEFEVKSKKTQERVKNEGGKALENLKIQLKKVFQNLESSVQDFAESNWEKKEVELNEEWKNHLKHMKIEELINKIYKEVAEDYSKNVFEILEELGREMELISRMKNISFSLKEQDSSSFLKNLFKWGGLLISLAGMVGTFIPPLAPFAWAITLAGTLINIISGLFTSRAEKRRKAVEKISNSLIEQLEKQEENVIEYCIAQLEDQERILENEVKSYFDSLIRGLYTIGREMNAAEIRLSQIIDTLNMAYAKRVIDWIEGNQNQLTSELINNDVKSVEREIGKEIKIYSKRRIKFRIGKEHINNVLQENVQFIRN